MTALAASVFSPPQIDWAALSPVLIVLGAALLGILLETFLPQRARRNTQLIVAILALAAALLASAWQWGVIDGGVRPAGTVLSMDRPALLLGGFILIVGLLAVLVMADRTEVGEDSYAAQVSAVPGSAYEEQARKAGMAQTEVFPLLLFAVGGMQVFVAASDLLTMFVALEVLSLPLYLLTASARRRRLLSQEAAMKYFLLGAYASAFFLFGTALIYGFAGSVHLGTIAAAVSTTVGLDGLLLAGGVLVLIGLFFKMGAVPFHSWTPDVYQGAPSPVTGFMAAAVKIAAFGALLRVLYVGLPALEWDYRPALWAVAILTMVVGTVIAIVQTDIKRMLAYSSIAHAGFVLTALVAMNQQSISAVMFYLAGYGVSTVGAFACVALVRERNSEGVITSEANHISQWAGLGRRSPVLASVFTLFLLSFAGIPATAGFTGKFAVFLAAIEGGAAWLVVIGVLASAAAAFFYVRIIVLMFFTEPADDNTAVVASDGLSSVAVAAAVIVTLVLGIIPSGVLELTDTAAAFLP